MLFCLLSCCHSALHTQHSLVQPARPNQGPFPINAQVSGTVEKDGAPIKGLKLKGKWDTELAAEMPDGSSRRLWAINPPAADPSRCGTHASAMCSNSWRSSSPAAMSVMPHTQLPSVHHW